MHRLYVTTVSFFCSLSAYFSDRYRLKRHCEHVGGKADMSEESPASRAPSCAVTRLLSPENTHLEGLYTPPHTPAGTYLQSDMHSTSLFSLCVLVAKLPV